MQPNETGPARRAVSVDTVSRCSEVSLADAVAGKAIEFAGAYRSGRHDPVTVTLSTSAVVWKKHSLTSLHKDEDAPSEVWDDRGGTISCFHTGEGRGSRS